MVFFLELIALILQLLHSNIVTKRQRTVLAAEFVTVLTQFIHGLGDQQDSPFLICRLFVYDILLVVSYSSHQLSKHFIQALVDLLCSGAWLEQIHATLGQILTVVFVSVDGIAVALCYRHGDVSLGLFIGFQRSEENAPMLVLLTGFIGEHVHR